MAPAPVLACHFLESKEVKFLDLLLALFGRKAKPPPKPPKPIPTPVMEAFDAIGFQADTFS